MKTLTALLCVLVLIPAGARILTVSNNPVLPAQYPDVQSAINAATAGDTVFVHGSQFTYADFTITKRLVMIGAGYNSNNQFNYATRVNIITISHDTGLQNGNGSVITGFYVNSFIQGAGTVPVSNISIFRNFVGNIIYAYSNGSVLATNWLIYNNIIYQIYGASSGPLSASSSNITIQNNIIYGNISNFSMSSVLIDHNVFQAGSNHSLLYYATITNNIYLMTSGMVMASNVASNTFNNNLCILSTIGPNSPTNSFLGGPNSGAGNFVAVDPQFVNVPASYYNTFSYSLDYRLKVTSPVHNAGTDGTDLGIYGGSYPFPSGGASGSGFDTSPLPPIPQVTDVNIQNATLQPGTPLNVNVKARVNN